MTLSNDQYTLSSSSSRRSMTSFFFFLFLFFLFPWPLLPCTPDPFFHRLCTLLSLWCWHLLGLWLRLRHRLSFYSRHFWTRSCYDRVACIEPMRFEAILCHNENELPPRPVSNVVSLNQRINAFSFSTLTSQQAVSPQRMWPAPRRSPFTPSCGLPTKIA